MKGITNIYNKLFGPTDAEMRDGLIARAATIHADSETARLKADFYAAIVVKTDPHADWWGFADAKQKHHEYATEHGWLAVQAQRAFEQAEQYIG
jgi:hypothetical protein